MIERMNEWAREEEQEEIEENEKKSAAHTTPTE